MKFKQMISTVATRIRVFSYASMSLLYLAANLQAETVSIGERQFTIPNGYELKLATTPGLTERPIVVDFDNDGHLFVAESSGTNDNVQKQLEDKPHSILRLTDSDDDGVYDKRTVFADGMMFPAGVLCHRGSVYVSAPPQIWKLTDTDTDGVANEREVWFDAKTLTGCANDLHGPFLGPDGWIYWCKGAFAEQTYDRHRGVPLVTRAAHIFRRRPEGGLIEPVMTGGMDNPVEVAFTATGERIFTTTFFQHPANGQRDGLVHAIYGGVYGKKHGVIDGHPRTGDLMPVMTHMGAAAPSGITRLDSDALGFRDQLLTACFNLHSVTRHELVPHGGSFQTKDSDLVSTDNLDFHPTDVTEDADGSVLIVDTGGWYKLCCPSSQLHKPDVAGAIYRLSKAHSKSDVNTGPNSAPDAWGRAVNWPHQTAEELAALLIDTRSMVRQRAVDELARVGDAALPSLRRGLTTGESSAQKRNAIWALCRIDTPLARATVRLGLNDGNASVRHSAAHAVSVWRDEAAIERLGEMLLDESPQVQRAAAEAIGRIGSKVAVPKLLDRLQKETDRVLEHSLIYALIEIDASDQLRQALTSTNVRQQRAALLALRALSDAKPSQPGVLSVEDISPFLVSNNNELRDVAARIALSRPDWSENVAQLFRNRIANDPQRLSELTASMGMLSDHPAISQYVSELLTATWTNAKQRIELLEATTNSDDRLDPTLTKLFQSKDPPIIAAIVRRLSQRDKLSDPLLSELRAVAKSDSGDSETRLLAARQLKQIDDPLFAEVRKFLAHEQPVRLRSLAASVLENLKLGDEHLLELATAIGEVGPLELGRLLRLFESKTDIALGRRLFRSLNASSFASALPAEQVAKLAGSFDNDVLEMAQPLLAKMSIDPAEQSRKLDETLDALPAGDIRRGQKLFHDQKLACFTCHAIGYRGGTVGPDLSRIGRTRSRRDLLEAIVFPSASFVRSYEPVNILLSDGRQLTGTIRNQSTTQLELQLNATEAVKVSLADVDELLPSKLSIMPSGLDKQLSAAELSDLLAFLESRK